MPSAAYFQGQPLKLAPGPQLLLDDVLVEDRFYLERVPHYPVKHNGNPVLVRDKPWEGDLVQTPSAIWDESYGKYRMWYTCFNLSNYYSGGPVYYAAYAESDDGFHWEKPLLDICPLGSHHKTNIVYTGHTADYYGKKMFAQGQVFKDDADPDPARRYKMVALDGRPHPRYPKEVNYEPSLLASPDGFHWTVTGDYSIFDHHSDTSNHMVRDEANDRWLLYVRPSVYSSGRDMGEDHRHHRRRLCVMMSRDLKTWSYPRVVLYPDERDLPDYDHASTFRVGSHFLMLYAAMDGDGLARFETRLASSGDGLHWHRFHSRETLLKLGREGSWDEGVVSPGGEPIGPADSEMKLLYFSGGNVGQYEAFTARRESSTAIGVATMKANRFVAQRAGERTGYLLTREFTLEGDTLTLNLSGDSGPRKRPRLRVEVLRHPPLGEHADFYFMENGYSYKYPGFGFDDCVPLAGDGTKARVNWKEKQLGELRGKPVYLRFELTDMDLYAFAITQS
jgi:hypothetical protein